MQVNDCLVFAADSAVTLSFGPNAEGAEVINVLPHGNKVFNLHRHLPVCAMTCGTRQYGSDSITTLAKELRALFMHSTGEYLLDPGKYSIEEVAIKARKFLFEEKFQALKDKPKSELSFYVGGYSSGANMPERWLVRILSGSNESPAPECLGKEVGLCWGGQPEAVYRLVMGVSSNHGEALTKAGRRRTGQVCFRVALLKELWQAPVLHPAMPVQDAVDFADFLVETTKRFVRFLPGADTVGGDTDIAVVTKHEGFKWVRRKALLRPRT